jgi:ring-1,2-phenylacetyl-CoA epoxidase subunit PaaA
MYGNILNTERLDVLTEDDDPIKLREFEARITSGDKIEPKYWMPSLYKNNTLELLINILIPKLSGS